MYITRQTTTTTLLKKKGCQHKNIKTKVAINDSIIVLILLLYVQKNNDHVTIKITFNIYIKDINYLYLYYKQSKSQAFLLIYPSLLFFCYTRLLRYAITFFYLL